MRSRCRQQLVNAFERSQQTSLLRLRPQPLKWSCARRTYASAAPATQDGESGDGLSGRRSLAIPSQARHNDIGVQQVSAHVHPQLFPSTKSAKPDEQLIALSREHLSRHDLLGKTSDNSEPIGFDLPQLHGTSLDEHFYKLGMDSAEPYLGLARKYARASPPARPRRWVQRSGWTKYHADGSSEDRKSVV